MKSSHYAPIILAQEGPMKGRNWLIKDAMVIGREADCDISIPDRQVSRSHARFNRTKDNRTNIIDNESKNGTYLNGERIFGSHMLEDGDVIKIALIQEFIFFSSDATLPLESMQPKQISPTQKLFIDEKARRIWIGEEELLPPLSVSQYKLLSLLYHSASTVVSRDAIIASVWGQSEAIGVSEQALDALVRRLRTRLRKIDSSHEYIATIRGVGYIFKNDLFED